MNRWTHSLASRLAICTALALGLTIGFVAAQENPLSIDDYGVGTDVVDRQLKGEGDRFEEGSKVVFLTRVIGGTDGDRIRHVWLFEKEEIPWDEIAFHSSTFAIEKYFEFGKSYCGVHVGSYDSKQKWEE